MRGVWALGGLLGIERNVWAWCPGRQNSGVCLSEEAQKICELLTTLADLGRYLTGRNIGRLNVSGASDVVAAEAGRQKYWCLC